MNCPDCEKELKCVGKKWVKFGNNSYIEIWVCKNCYFRLEKETD